MWLLFKEFYTKLLWKLKVVKSEKSFSKHQPKESYGKLMEQILKAALQHNKIWGWELCLRDRSKIREGGGGGE